MKIAMIGQKGIPVASGGVERHVEEISRRLVENGHYVTVYNRMGYSQEKSGIYAGIHLKDIFTLRNKGLESLVYSLLASIDALRDNYDIIHFHALGPATMSFIPRAFGKKVVITVHGLDWQRDKWGRLAKAYLKLGEKASAHIPDKTITVSEKLKRYYMEKYKKNVSYIPNGIIEPDYAAADKIREYELERSGYILFLARIVPEKGCHYLLEAFKDINTGTKLVIAGGSSYTDGYYNHLKKIAGNNVVFTGEVRGRILEELYSNALFYVLPSDIEGMPISLLEAMSYGLCPLISNIDENMEIVYNNGRKYGFFFESGNIESLRKMLCYMLDNPGITAEIGKKAKEFVTGRFNWDLIVKELEQLYFSVVYDSA